MPGPGTTLDGPTVGVVAGSPLQIPGLRPIRLLARGGFAEVWEADQVSLGRHVAVKVLRQELLGQPQMVQLFNQEARVLARLNHPNVVQVIDRGTSPQGPYFVMEYIEGETLQELLTKKQLSRDRAMSIMLQAARGLAYAHRNKVIHRDVKPANILVARTGQVKISDFGIAAVRKAAGEDEPEDPQEKKTALGTRAFMAPEQRTAFDQVGPEADVYSLGVILHRIIAGRLPPQGNMAALEADIPDRLRSILERSLQPSPGRRYPNAGAFREALVNALEGRHIEDRVKRGAANSIGVSGRFELLDVIRQDNLRSVYLVRKGGPGGERIVVKRYLKDVEALRTVRNLIRIEHPHIVRIHAVGEREDSFIMLMEHMAGGDLRERMVQSHPWQEAVRVGRQVATALAFAHQHGIIHGNLRPSNILFDESGQIRVTDFGLPEHYRGVPGMRNWYAAPDGERSHQSDIYALGAILYEMVFATAVSEAGMDPWKDESRLKEIPRPVLKVMKRLLAPLPERFQSAEEVARELGRIEDMVQARAAEVSGPVASPAAVAAPLGFSRHLPALLGLGGLILVWLLQRPAVQRWLVDYFAHP